MRGCSVFCLFVPVLLVAVVSESSSMSNTEKDKLRDQVKEMFRHAYDSYMSFAYPADELMPLSCKGRVRGVDSSRGDVDDSLGMFSLTLVDTLDTLAVLGEVDEFDKAVKLVIRDVTFDTDIVVSVFETNIRMVGGLLGGHVAAVALKKADKGMAWYKNELLDMAKDIATRILPAFNTSTGIPYPKVNLKFGIHHPESNTGTEVDTCTACAGTMIMEFGALSRLTGDPIFEEKAKKAMEALWRFRSRASDLVGTVINIHNGDWVRRDSGVGAGIDSYYEYCLKAYILLGDDAYLDRFNKHYKSIMQYINQGAMFLSVQMHQPERTSHAYMDALQAFWPGLQVLKGDLKKAIETHQMLYEVAKRHTFLPEAFTTDFEVHWGEHPLRPELVESTYYLYEATQDPYYLEVGKNIIEKINEHARVPCGFAALKDVRTLSHEDRMDSFVLAETFKYLYLLFTDKKEWTLPINEFIFTTEAHLLPLSLSNISPNGTAYEQLRYNVTLSPENEHDFTCPNTGHVEGKVAYAEEVRRQMLLNNKGSCRAKPNTFTFTNSKPPRLRAEQFVPGNSDHINILKTMGITVVHTKEGKIQLMHTASSAHSQDDAEEGIKFMQEMIELAKQRNDDTNVVQNPRVVQLMSPPYGGSIVLNAGPAQFGLDLTKGDVGVGAEVSVADPIKACSPLNNQDHAKHRIVIMERGECMFIDKARHAQKAGAVAVIIIDNNDGSSSDSQPIFAMAGDGTSDDVHIPAVLLFHQEGQILRRAVAALEDTAQTLRVRVAAKAASSDIHRKKNQDTSNEEQSKVFSEGVMQAVEKAVDGMSQDRQNRKDISQDRPSSKDIGKGNELQNGQKPVDDQMVCGSSDKACSKDSLRRPTLSASSDSPTGSPDSQSGSSTGLPDSQSDSITGSQDSQSDSITGSQGSQSDSITGSQDSKSGCTTGSSDSQSDSITGSQGSQSDSKTGSQDSQSDSITGSSGSSTGLPVSQSDSSVPDHKQKTEYSSSPDTSDDKSRTIQTNERTRD